MLEDDFDTEKNRTKQERLGSPVQGGLGDNREVGKSHVEKGHWERPEGDD